MTWELQAADPTEAKLADAAELALAEARTRGADGAALGIGEDLGLSLTVRHGEVETVEHQRDKALNITVYFGHRRGLAHTTDLTADGIRATAAAACNIARITESDPCSGLPDRDRLATEFPDLDLYHPWAQITSQSTGEGSGAAMAELIEIATQCEHAALTHHRQITNSEGATLASHHGVGLHANSHGFRAFARSSRHTLSCAVIASENGAMQRDHWYDTARAAPDLISPAVIGERAAQRTIARLGARKVRTGEYPVLFEAPIAASLLSHLVGAVSGASLYRKATFLLDKIGEPLFPDMEVRLT